MAEGTQIATAYVQVVPTTKGIVNELNQQLGGAGESAGREGGSRFASAFKTGAGVAAAGVAAVATAAATATKAIWDNTAQVAEYGDNIDKMSQKMGLSAQAYQEWDFIMQHNGASIDSLQASMKTLANAVENENDAFGRLGITQEDIASMDNEELFSATIAALQNVDDETERTYLAGQLLGRGATELGPLLNMTAEETEAMRQQVHDLGGVMSDESVKAAAGFQDSLQNLQTGFSGLKNSMMSQFLPAAVSIMDGLTAIVTGDSSGLGLLSSGINDFVSNMTAILPDILNVGMGIVDSLLEAIISNLPMLIEAGTGILMSLTESIITYLPMLADVGVQILTTLVSNISSSLPTLIPAAVEAIITIVTALTDPANLNALVDGAIALIMALANGLIAALPQLIAAAPVIITNLITALATNIPALLSAGVDLLINLVGGIISAIPEVVGAAGEIITSLITGLATFYTNLVSAGAEIVSKVKEGVSNMISGAAQWGRDLISNFISGITEKWSALKESVSGLAGTIAGYLHFSEPDVGPLSDFHTYAPDMMDLFAQGIRDNTGNVEDAVMGMTRSVAGGVDPGLTMTPNVSSGNIAAAADPSVSRLLSLAEQYFPLFAKAQIFLESGAMVGAMAYDIDSELGVRSGYAERGMVT